MRDILDRKSYLINKDLDISIGELSDKAQFSGKNYILICHASYEERSLSICDHDFKEGMIELSILLSSKEYIDKQIYSKNKIALKQFLDVNTKGDVKDIVAERDQPIANLEKISDSISGIDVSKYNFLVDISTFPRDRLICLLILS